MEKVNCITDANILKDNLIFIEGGIDETENFLEDTQIEFMGKNNLLFLEKGANIKNSIIKFTGDNSVIYLSRSGSTYYLDCYVGNNSVIFLGKNCYINPHNNTRMLLWATERQNIIIGNDSIFSFGINMRTADPHIVYCSITKKRINMSKSILIGDHVWIGQNSLILKGTVIGSGAIVGANSVCANKKICSNTSVAGNPIRLIQENVFFLREIVHSYLNEDTLKSMEYENEDYIFSKDKNSIEMEKIDGVLKNQGSSIDALNIIKKFLVENNCKNRFFI